MEAVAGEGGTVAGPVVKSEAGGAGGAITGPLAEIVGAPVHRPTARSRQSVDSAWGRACGQAREIPTPASPRPPGRPHEALPGTREVGQIAQPATPSAQAPRNPSRVDGLNNSMTAILRLRNRKVSIQCARPGPKSVPAHETTSVEGEVADDWNGAKAGHARGGESNCAHRSNSRNFTRRLPRGTRRAAKRLPGKAKKPRITTSRGGEAA